MSKKNVNTSSITKSSSAVAQAVEEFRSIFKKSVLDVLEMGRVVARVKSDLNQTDFEEFCKEVGYSAKSSSIKKLKRIGDQHAILLKFSSSLPANWTSLYEISKLTDRQIEKFVDSGEINPHVKGSEIQKLNGQQPRDRKEENVTNAKNDEVLFGTKGCAFVCELIDINDVALKAKIQKFVEGLKRYSAKVKVVESEQFKKVLFAELKEAA